MRTFYLIAGLVVGAVVMAGGLWWLENLARPYQAFGPLPAPDINHAHQNSNT